MRILNVEIEEPINPKHLEIDLSIYIQDEQEGLIELQDFVNYDYLYYILEGTEGTRIDFDLFIEQSFTEKVKQLNTIFSITVFPKIYEEELENLSKDAH